MEKPQPGKVQESEPIEIIDLQEIKTMNYLMALIFSALLAGCAGLPAQRRWRRTR